jgi:hypothetical protein
MKAASWKDIVELVGIAAILCIAIATHCSRIGKIVSNSLSLVT